MAALSSFMSTPIYPETEMYPANSESPKDDFFNDLPRNGNSIGSMERPQSPKDTIPQDTTNEGGEAYVPRTKRIACVVCRKRKLKCDGKKPSCGTCRRLGHTCAYDEVRKKSGPKRGYVKHLEARLAQVETLLKTHEPSDQPESSNAVLSMPSADFPYGPEMAPSNRSVEGRAQLIPNLTLPDLDAGGLMDNLGMMADDNFSWELISLGLEEPLPSKEVIDDIHHVYFEKIHPSLPIIHRPRYLAAMDLAPHMRPPICLRYAIWTHVCSITPKYSALRDHFYARARKYAEQDEMRGFGESMITVAHSQCWSLIATYEFKMMYFPRAWMSVGRATRLSQMMSLHRQDGATLDVKQALPPPRDWTEREERRRTFWLAFCQDRYASIGTGWPMTIDERDISTNLPSTEEAFVKSKPEETLPLAGVMTPDGASTLSPFAGVVLMACLFGRNLTHLHRSEGEDNDQDLNGEFWKRHRSLDNILLNTSLSLPNQLRLPAGINDSNIVFVNMNIHASTICLHQAAIFKVDKNHMSPQISVESKQRCIIAADQIANIMKLVSHVDLSTMNPFIAFCLYVAARVFVQYLKTHKNDNAVTSSLQFLLAAMQALKAKNPLTESFLVQLDVDLEGSGLRLPADPTGQSSMPSHAPYGQSVRMPPGIDQLRCTSIFDLHAAEDRTQATAVNPKEPGALQATSGNPIDFSREPNTQGQLHLGNIPDRSRDSPRPPAPAPVFGGMPSMYDDISGGIDMDMSFENLSSQRYPSQSNSGHPTPSTSSNNASSQTSFSPRHPDDNPKLPTTSSFVALPPSPATAFPSDKSFPSFVPRLSNSSDTSGPEGAPNPFAMPAAWNHADNIRGEEGTAGELEVTGMTPGDAPPWQPMSTVEGNEWLFSNWSGVDTST